MNLAEKGTAELQRLDSNHYLHPFTDPKALLEKGARVITSADGIYIWDSDGEKILDAMAGLWCVNVGYGREVLSRIAYEQSKELPYYNSFFKTTTPPAIALAEKLVEVTPDGFNQVFYTNSGSEANDTVIRTVRRYWRLLEKPEKRIIISRKRAYHGSTVAAASLCGDSIYHEMDGLPIPDIVHVDCPYWYGEGGDLTPDEFGLKSAQSLESKIKELGPEKVAAFIGEPIQGAGGLIVPPDTYWPEIQRICDKYGILLISDEVICGFGRTGNWFGCETYGFKPDLMPIAKGLSSGYMPIGGVMIHDKIAEVLIKKGGEFSHGYTYSGHPVACAVALGNLKIIEEEQLVEKVAKETGPYLKKRWQEFENHPLVGEVRTVGMLGAIELVEDKDKRKFFDSSKKVGDTCRDFCFENNLVMRALHDAMVVSPPLTITVEQIDEMFDLVKLCLDLTADKFGIS